MNLPEKIPVIAILGPTASGKSSLALELAKFYNCEIVNCDSRQIYREMSIGTAKPSIEEQKQVPHHLFDLVAPDENFSAGNYVQKAANKIREISTRAKIPLLTGGTGFYYNAISEGLPATEGDEKIANELRAYFENSGISGLQKMLEELDPEAYLAIDRNNPRRLLRALEIVKTTGKPFSQNKPVSSLPEATFLPIVVSRPREILHRRIEVRVKEMIKNGLENEAHALVEKFGTDAPGLKSIGYEEWFDFFSGEKNLGQVTEEIIINSRQYAKRQETWFKKRPGKEFFNIESPVNVRKIVEQIEAFLKSFRL